MFPTDRGIRAMYEMPTERVRGDFLFGSKARPRDSGNLRKKISLGLGELGYIDKASRVLLSLHPQQARCLPSQPITLQK
jgi:hypothetical protein